MKPLAPNTLFQNRYLIVHLIGRGGMGEVYLAVDQRLGSAVALKRTFFAEDQLLGGAFEREARTLARLRHPVLPKVTDHFVENENQFLVMEHISGEDLAKRLEAAQKPFPLNWVLFWADQLLDALAYLHSHEPPVIHRDIKPQNLKLTDENNIILLDFGLSKNTVGQTTISSSGSVVGYTPQYAPMEQIRGTGTNSRSDIYSLSATLYHLLTNTVPPDALARADSLLAGGPDPLQPLSEINREVPPYISEVILKGMAISQEQRYGNAREMQRLLREAYAQLQSAMAAKTVAFNTQNEAPADSRPGAPEKADQYPSAGFGNQPPSKEAMGAQTVPMGFSVNSAPETAGSTNIETPKTERPQDFDSTIRYDSQSKDFSSAQTPPPVDDALPKQSGIKTEILLADDLVAGAVEENKEAPPEEHWEMEGFGHHAQTPPAEEKFPPDATVPFISFDNKDAGAAEQNRAASFDASAEDFSTAGAGFTPTETYSSGGAGYSQPVHDLRPAKAEEEYKPAPAHSQPPPKKSNAVVLAIVGGLFALLFLAAGAAGLAWYVYNQQDDVNIPNTASPTVEITPTPAPTVEEAVTGQDQPIDESLANENTAEETPGKTDPKQEVPAKTGPPERVSTPVKSGAPTRTPALKTPAKTPPPKTPASTPAGRRTDILQ